MHLVARSNGKNNVPKSHRLSTPLLDKSAADREADQRDGNQNQ